MSLIPLFFSPAVIIVCSFFSLRPKADLRFSWQLGLHLEGTPSRCGSPSHGSDVACCCLLGSHAEFFFVSFFHQSWSNRTYPVLHPVICCDCWLEKTSRLLLGVWNFPIGMLDRRNSGWFIKNPLTLWGLKTTEGTFRSFEGGNEAKMLETLQVFLESKLYPNKMLEIPGFFLEMVESNYPRYQHIILNPAPRCRRRRGRMHQRVPENPPNVQKKGGIPCHSGNWFGVDVGRKRPWKEDPSNCLNWCLF